MNDSAPLIIDSFLAVDGRVTWMHAHRDRFEWSVRECYGDLADGIPVLLDDLAVRIERGRRFPRLEARPDGLTWVDRPAPTEQTVLRVAAEPVADDRRLPQHKGPELEWLQRIATHGDVVLVRDGLVAETTTAALVVRDASHPARWLAPAAPALASTTAAWFAAQVESVERTPLTWLQLADTVAEGRAFALNALHGVRPLVIGEEAEADSSALALAEGWCRRWLDDAEPLR